VVKHVTRQHRTRDSTIYITIDNTTVQFCIRRLASRTRIVNGLIRELEPIVTTEGNTLLCYHSPGALNQFADMLSRDQATPLQSLAETTMPRAAFRQLTRLYGARSIDLMANQANARCKRWISPEQNFYRLHHIPDHAYLFPPPNQIPNVLQRLRHVPYRDLLRIVPLWMSAVWFPSLRQRIRRAAAVVVLEPGQPSTPHWLLLCARLYDNGQTDAGSTWTRDFCADGLLLLKNRTLPCGELSQDLSELSLPQHTSAALRAFFTTCRGTCTPRSTT